MNIYVSIVDSTGKKQTFQIREKPIIIGRSKSSHVTIKDDLASSQHMSVWHEGDQVYIEDLKSKNGLYLNGIKILKQRIYVGDTIKFGDTVLTIEENKMDKTTTQLLTSLDSTRIAGDLTLEVETYHDRSKRIKLKLKKGSLGKGNEKLFAGVEESKKRSENFSKTSLMLREYAATLIDTALALAGASIPFIGLKFGSPESYAKYIDPKLGYAAYYSGDAVYLAGVGALIAFIFFKWNRGRKKGSIGEKICGLD